jgi:hypothetical protein
MMFEHEMWWPVDPAFTSTGEDERHDAEAAVTSNVVTVVHHTTVLAVAMPTRGDQVAG